jgi:dephospho-CoA kinase
MPYRVEVSGLLGRNPSLAKNDVEVAGTEVQQARDALFAAERAIKPGRSPLSALAEEFGLSHVAQLILLAVAAPAQWGELARLYGILGNDEARPLCDELLLQQLLDGEASRTDVARELDRDAPLVRHGLVRPGDGRMRPFIALTVEPIVLRRLSGRTPDEDLGELRIIKASCTFETLITSAATKDALVRDLATPAGDKPPRIVIRGRVGSGRHTVLAILAEATGRRLAVLDATSMVRDLRTRADQLKLALRRAHVIGLLPCIDGLEHIGSDDQITREAVREIIAQHPGALAIRLPWDAEPPIEAGHLAINLPQLTGDQRLTAWTEVLAHTGLFVRDTSELAIRYSVGPGVMSRAAELVGLQPGVRGDNGERPDVAPQLETAIRQHLETRLRATATRVARLATWSQVILPPDIQESLLELIARIKHRRIVYDVWGYDTVMSTSRGVTALFQGGPGTGKTLVASAIANELGMDLYRVDVSRIMSKWIGETEQNLAKLFDAAEDGHAIILFDEADSLFGKRTEVRTSVDRYANLEVNYLLQRLDTFEGIAILTTNFGTAIDSAFKRRLSFRLTFPFPDEEMREKLWAGHLPPDVPRAGEFDLASLARRFRLSGGYIRNAALRAAFLAAEEHTPLTQDHLERAIRAEFREIGKLSESGVLE